MKLLLDTQSFLVAANENGRLSKKAVAAYQNPENDLFLSVVSVWEIQIKVCIGKLTLPTSPREAIQIAINEVGIKVLSIDPEHIFQLSELPFHHRDPFDRLIISQAIIERMTLISGDRVFDKYGIERIW